MTPNDPWFVEAFRAEYLEVYAHRDLESARRDAEYLTAHGVAGRVLDLCCGAGRHTLALRERGVDVFGIDLSHDLLVHAQRSPDVVQRAPNVAQSAPNVAQRAPNIDLLRNRLARGDARRVPLTDASVDAVVLMFSSFGYFDDDGDRQVLAEIRRISRSGAHLVLDLMNPARVRSGLVPFSSRRVDGALLEERRSLEGGGRRVVKEVRYAPAGGRERSWRESVRMYEPAEIDALLREQGFSVLASHGGFDAAPFTTASERQIVHALRRSP